jgi:hypothetical protein
LLHPDIFRGVEFPSVELGVDLFEKLHRINVRIEDPSLLVGVNKEAPVVIQRYPESVGCGQMARAFITKNLGLSFLADRGKGLMANRAFPSGQDRTIHRSKVLRPILKQEG